MEINTPPSIVYNFFSNAQEQLYSNGFQRDSEDGLVYAPQEPLSEKELRNQELINIYLSRTPNKRPLEPAPARPEPLNQPKSDEDECKDTVNGYLFLKRLLKGLVDVQINDINSSHDLLDSEFRVHYDEVTAGCDVCAQLEVRRNAIYSNGTSIIYESDVPVGDLFEVKYCEIPSA